MFGKKQLKDEITKLKSRVEQLEFMICKGDHEWVKVSEYCSYDYYCDSYTHCAFQCKRCGKIRHESWP